MTCECPLKIEAAESSALMVAWAVNRSLYSAKEFHFAIHSHDTHPHALILNWQAVVAAADQDQSSDRDGVCRKPRRINMIAD